MKPYYEEAGITIYHGDCRQILPQLGRFDAVVTDPPYGVSLEGKRTKRDASKSNLGYLSIDDSPEIIEEVVRPIVQLCIDKFSRVVVMPGVRNMYKYPEPAEVGCVFNPSGAGLGKWGFICCHPILYYGSCPYLATGKGHRPNGMHDIAAGETVPGHPCPKPLRWMKFLVAKATLPEQSILDPFMGSGTTLIAAKELYRSATGIEIEERYCEIAANRLRQSVFNFEEKSA